MTGFIGQFLYSTQEHVLGFLHAHTLLAPFLLLMIEEAGIPMPVPGDVTITYLGYQVAKGNVSYPIAMLVVVAALLSGATILYTISYRWGEMLILKVGKYIRINKKKLQFIEKKYQKYGPLVIIFGRHIPGFLIPITIFSGISKIPYYKFIFFVLLSRIFLIPFYISLGMKLGPKTRQLFHTFQHFYYIPIILVCFVLIYLYLRKRRADN